MSYNLEVEDVEDLGTRDFINQAQSPDLWFDRGVGLMNQSTIFWDLSSNMVAKEVGDEIEKGEDPEMDPLIARRALSLRRTSIFLCALSLENTLKGHLVKEMPEKVEISIKVDGNGEIDGAKIEKVAGRPLNHDLSFLSEKSNLYDTNENAAINKEENLEKFRESMEYLTKVIVWEGRYPLPKKYEDQEWMEDKAKDAISSTFRSMPISDFAEWSYGVAGKLVFYITDGDFVEPEAFLEKYKA